MHNSKVIHTFDAMKGYKKGELLTVGELKALPVGSVIHLWYEKPVNEIRCNQFVTIDEFDGINPSAGYGYSMPIDGHEDSEPIDMFDNCGWTFTVHKAIKKN